MSQYNIVGCGVVAPDHGIIGYLTGAEVFMELMQRWQDDLQGFVLHANKEALEYLATGEGPGEENIHTTLTTSLCDKMSDVRLSRADATRLKEFMRAVSKEYRVWDFNQGIDSNQRDDEYTEGLCIIHNLYREGQEGNEVSDVLIQYFADRLAHAIVRALRVAYEEPLCVFMKRHPKDFSAAMVKMQLVQGVSRFGMLLKLED